MADRYDDLQCLAYIEGDLAPEQRAEFEKTLANDPSLRSLIGDLQEHRRLLQAMPNEPVPQEVQAGVADRLARRMLLEPAGVDPSVLKATQKRRPRLRIGRLAMAAAVVLATSVAITVYVQDPQEPQPLQPGFTSQLATRIDKSGPNGRDNGQALPKDLIALAEKRPEERSELATNEALMGTANKPARIEADARTRATEKRKQVQEPTHSKTTPMAEQETHVTLAKRDREWAGKTPATPQSSQAPAPDTPTASDESAGENALAMVTPTARSNSLLSANQGQATQRGPQPAQGLISTFADTPVDPDVAFRQGGQNKNEAFENEDPVVIDMLAENIDQGQKRLLALADRYGAHVSVIGGATDGRRAGARSYDHAKALKENPSTQEVRLTIEEDRLPLLLDEIAKNTGSGTDAERVDHKMLSGDNVDKTMHPAPQDAAGDPLQALWGAAFGYATSPTWVAGLTAEPNDWRPPMLQLHRFEPSPNGKPRASKQRTVVVRIKVQPATGGAEPSGE